MVKSHDTAKAKKSRLYNSICKHILEDMDDIYMNKNMGAIK